MRDDSLSSETIVKSFGKLIADCLSYEMASVLARPDENVVLCSDVSC